MTDLQRRGRDDDVDDLIIGHAHDDTRAQTIAVDAMFDDDRKLRIALDAIVTTTPSVTSICEHSRRATAHRVSGEPRRWHPARRMDHLLTGLRRARWAHLCVINLRFLIGFAFVPAAMKKLLDQPFTDPANTGPFHGFLHAFHATGWFYQLVGALQLAAAVLLFTQRRALLGALLALPILTAIVGLCWSTRVVPTAIVATLMWLGTLGLILWDLDRWRGVVFDTPAPVRSPDSDPALVDLRLWQACGALILALYGGVCLAHGGVYRPRGADLGSPAFYVLPTIAALPVVTWLIERTRRRRAA